MEDLRFVNDLVFKYIFGNKKNEKILIALLNAILNLKGNQKIKKIDFLNSLDIAEFRDDKSTILDIKAKDETGKYYNIEMQVIPKPYYIERILYYYSKLYGQQLKKNDDYAKLKKTISISILDCIIIKEEKSLHNIYQLLNVESYKKLTEHFEFHFIELSKFKIDKPKKLQTAFEKWLHVLKFEKRYVGEDMKLPDILKNEDGIEMAIEALRYANSDENLRELIEAREKAEHDRATYVVEAIKEAKKKGLNEGRNEGRNEGIKKGEKKANLKTAKKMLLKGLDLSLISEMTGLSIEKLEKLK